MKDEQSVINVSQGLSFGSALAIAVSYNTWHHLGWAILHGIFGWLYVIYYALVY
ncbi:hypothetical protein LCGC14_2133860 [marine sediment metagenome]|uniref:Uncharacterized protein n=1 Tax=marine sediment metagenome TaxID=412755 RepID=A0A0F9E0K2_9ZZZZ